VLWHCWLGDGKGIRPVKKLGVGLLVVIFDWSFARFIAPVVQLSPSPPSSFASINTGPANLGPPRKLPLKRGQRERERERASDCMCSLFATVCVGVVSCNNSVVRQPCWIYVAEEHHYSTHHQAVSVSVFTQCMWCTSTLYSAVQFHCRFRLLCKVQVAFSALTLLIVRVEDSWLIEHSAPTISKVWHEALGKQESVWKKHLEETQTLPAGCSKTELKNFARYTPPSRRRGTAKI